MFSSHAAQLKQMHSEEIADLQLTMAKQEAIIECQKNELESLGEKLDEKMSQLDQCSRECTKMAAEISALKKTLTESTPLASSGAYEPTPQCSDFLVCACACV